jgi:hypothetical protein
MICRIRGGGVEGKAPGCRKITFHYLRSIGFCGSPGESEISPPRSRIAAGEITAIKIQLRRIIDPEAK